MEKNSETLNTWDRPRTDKELGDFLNQREARLKKLGNFALDSAL